MYPDSLIFAKCPYLSDCPGSLCVHGRIRSPSEGKLAREFIIVILQIGQRVHGLDVNALWIITKSFIRRVYRCNNNKNLRLHTSNVIKLCAHAKGRFIVDTVDTKHCQVASATATRLWS